MSFVQPVEPKAKKAPKAPKVKDIPEAVPSVEIDPIEKYQGITLNFGKWAGAQLKDVQAKDPKYIQWLKNRFKEKETELSPTMKAIIAFANAV